MRLPMREYLPVPPSMHLFGYGGWFNFHCQGWSGCLSLRQLVGGKPSMHDCEIWSQATRNINAGPKMSDDELFSEFQRTFTFPEKFSNFSGLSNGYKGTERVGLLGHPTGSQVRRKVDILCCISYHTHFYHTQRPPIKCIPHVRLQRYTRSSLPLSILAHLSTNFLQRSYKLYSIAINTTN